MKKLFLFTILLVSFTIHSQEIYLYKKIKKKKKWKEISIDSLVLYSDGSFYRKSHYQYHEIIDIVEKGEWSKKDNILTLHTKKKLDVFDEWISDKNIKKLKIRRKKIISIDEKKRSLNKIQ